MWSRWLRTALIGLSIILLTACGGGGGSGTTAQDDPEQGQFIDSSVAGLYYEATPSGLTGMTDVNGVFEYEDGDTVAFYIGDILIGETTGASVVTPVSLVPGAVDETNAVVSNIARLLQTLDDNDDPSDGITIPTAVFDAALNQSINFSDIAGFDAAAITLLNEIFTTVGTAAPTLVSAADAELHLAGSLVSANSGTYSGTWLQTMGPDSDNGVWTFDIDSTGELTGCGRSNVNSLEFFTMIGSVSSSGSIEVTGGSTNTGATFSGTIDANGNLSGTWENTGDGISGTFGGGETANPSIDCSPNNPDPGSSGEFGSLTISGDAEFGTSFSAIVSIPTFAPGTIYGTIAWSSAPDFASTLIGRLVSIGFNPSTSEVSAVYAGDTNAAGDVLLYQLLCSAGDCSGISIDMTARTVTFNNLSVPVDTSLGFNVATSPITLTGTLTYPDTP